MIPPVNVEKSHLYVVATPIGNPRDITLRAMDILQEVDAVICEEQREGSTLLKKLGITKEIILLNEHNEPEMAADIVMRLHMGQALALVSDCGTPVFADPGATLIAQVVEQGLQVVPIPGPSSLMATLSVLDFKMDRFFYAGFLPRDKEERRSSLRYLRHLRMPIVIMDAPYRLLQVLDDIANTFGGGAKITLALDLTLPSEAILRGSADDIRKNMRTRKGEFVLIVH